MQLAPPEQFGRYAHRTTIEPTANAQDVWGSERRPKMVVPVFNGTENSEALLYIDTAHLMDLLLRIWVPVLTRDTRLVVPKWKISREGA